MVKNIPSVRNIKEDESIKKQLEGENNRNKNDDSFLMAWSRFPVMPALGIIKRKTLALLYILTDS